MNSRNTIRSFSPPQCGYAPVFHRAFSVEAVAALGNKLAEEVRAQKEGKYHHLFSDFFTILSSGFSF